MGNRIAKLYIRSKVGYRKPGKRLTDLPEGETYPWRSPKSGHTLSLQNRP
jgi:hypothetical protein